MPIRTGSAALGWAITESRSPSQDWERLCLRFVRTCLGVPYRYDWASLAWSHTTKRHGTVGHPPAGVPVWWSGGQFGHVALSAGGGFCWSNDIVRRGRIDKVRIASVTRGWGMTYRGYTEDINGVDVYPHHPEDWPRVGLDRVLDAARRDPNSKQGHASHPGDVKVIERALVKEGLLDDRWLDGAFGERTVKAYARWQRRLGYSGRDANGIPGEKSLRALSRKYRFDLEA